MVGIAGKNFRTVKKSSNGNPLRFQNNIPNHLKKLRCISPGSLVILKYTSSSSQSSTGNLRIRGCNNRTMRCKTSSLFRAPYNTNGAKGVLFELKALGLWGKGPRPRGKGLLRSSKEPSRTMFNRLIVWQTIRLNIRDDAAHFNYLRTMIVAYT